MTEKPFEVERRAVPRIQLSTRARLSPNEWSSIEVDVIDISSHGFKATCDLLMKPEARVAIDIPGIGSVQSYLVWCDRYEFGAKFAQPIDLANCDALTDQGHYAIESSALRPVLEHSLQSEWGHTVPLEGRRVRRL